MENRLIEPNVENFRSLRKVSLPLGPLNVLVGPNGAGKTNVLEVFRFLADVIRTDLEPALELRRGFDEVEYRGGERAPGFIKIGLKATWSEHSNTDAPDEYTLLMEGGGPQKLTRSDAPGPHPYDRMVACRGT
jgi:predicted ATPase